MSWGVRTNFRSTPEHGRSNTDRPALVTEPVVSAA